MKKCLFILISILFIGCTEDNEKSKDNLLLAKFNVLCKDHHNAKQVTNVREKNKVYSNEYLLCNDGYIIKNFDLEQVYGQEVYEEYQRLEKLKPKEK